MKITVDDVLMSPLVADPLRALDACLMSVGAACAILCDEDTAMELTKNSKNKPLRIWVTAGSHTLRPADRRDMEIPLLPNEAPDQYKDLGKEFPGGDRYPGFTGFLAARMAAYYGYRMTGIVDPTEDFDVIELHDAFTISDVQTYEDIGLRPYGHGRDYVESGDCYHTNPHTGKPGKLPSNLSGGLIGCMHAVGASGIMQVFEIATQLWGRWAEVHGDEKRWKEFGREKPADWTDLQVKGAKTGPLRQSRGRGVPRDGDRPHGPRSPSETRRVREADDEFIRTGSSKGRPLQVQRRLPSSRAAHAHQGRRSRLEARRGHQAPGHDLCPFVWRRGRLLRVALAGQADGHQVRQPGLRSQRFGVPAVPDLLSGLSGKEHGHRHDRPRKDDGQGTHVHALPEIGRVQQLDKPIRFINVEFEGVSTILFSYLLLGEPRIGMRVRPVFKIFNPTYTILDLSWVPAGTAAESLPEGFSF